MIVFEFIHQKQMKIQIVTLYNITMYRLRQHLKKCTDNTYVVRFVIYYFFLFSFLPEIVKM